MTSRQSAGASGDAIRSLLARPCRVIRDERAMQSLGEELAGVLPRGTLVTLTGELGVGKSVLVRSIIHALGYEGRVKSPTYTLMETYEAIAPDGEPCLVAHLDLYRLTDPAELDYLGFDDALHDHDFLFIEWPEQGGNRIPPADLQVNIAYAEDSARHITFHASQAG